MPEKLGLGLPYSVCKLKLDVGMRHRSSFANLTPRLPHHSCVGCGVQLDDGGVTLRVEIVGDAISGSARVWHRLQKAWIFFLFQAFQSTAASVDKVAPEGRAMFSHFAADQWHSQDMHGFVSDSTHSSIDTGMRRTAEYY